MVRYLLSFICSVVLLTGCSSSSQKMIPAFSGSVGEVVVVVPNPDWNGRVGDALKAVYQEPQYGLPQQEPMFTVINVQKANFTSVFETFRNIVRVHIDPQMQGKANYEMKKNQWAKDQIVVELYAPDKDAMVTLLEENKFNLQEIFNLKEIDRLIKRNNKFGSQKEVETIEATLGVSMVLQKDVRIAKLDSNFMWLRIERERPKGGYMHQISQGILVYSYDYTAQEQFSDSNLFAVRDSLIGTHVIGTSEGAHMVTDYKYAPPLVREIDYRNHYAKEMRGLWRMTVDIMGGPMYSLVFLDEQNNKIILASGYVFAPEFDKLEFIRETEAMIKSITIPEA